MATSAAETKHTPGPWPWVRTGDGKRIVIGAGLVDGPNGYEVAEVYSDDCDREVAEANARLIAAAPEMFVALREARDLLLAHDTISGTEKLEALIARIEADQVSV